jgi:cell wall-associated NlpC family hydrolase
VTHGSRPAGAAAASSALALRGTPYRLGGDQPSFGFDCSGLVRYVFLEQHIELPRTVIEQARIGAEISPDDIAPGDLIFFNITLTGPSHVGIALDGDTFVHAPGSGSVVRVERLSTPYWTQRISGIRRVTVAAWPRQQP